MEAVIVAEPFVEGFTHHFFRGTRRLWQPFDSVSVYLLSACSFLVVQFLPNNARLPEVGSVSPSFNIWIKYNKTTTRIIIHQLDEFRSPNLHSPFWTFFSRTKKRTEPGLRDNFGSSTKETQASTLFCFNPFLLVKTAFFSGFSTSRSTILPCASLHVACRPFHLPR